MKQRIFNQGRGWYISCTNYKDVTDKAYVGLYFPKNVVSPYYQDSSNGFTTKLIDIQEAQFTSYQGKVGLTIFKYEILPDDYKPKEKGETPKEESRQEEKMEQTVLSNDDSDMFGKLSDISSDDLPFY